MSVEIELSRDGRVQTWWLARPQARNAISLEMWQQLHDAATSLSSTVRVVVIRGRGEHFSAGADITALGRTLAADHEGSSYRAVNASAEAAIAGLPVPTVAAINGYCMGGAVQLALACDIRVATFDAQFAVTPAKIGIVYPASALQRLVAMVGPSAASELLLTAETVDATRAYEIGLVSRVVSDLDEAVRDLVNSLLARSPFTQRASKSIIRTLIDSVDVEELGRNFESASLVNNDLSEGLAAFREKRDPRFE